MGHNEGWAQPSGLLPNGLLPNEAASVTRPLEPERWMKAEERTAELIACIQPNQPSEELRNAVADYVQRLIMKCFSCQVFTFGSVPLKTYLPDGDIDLTAFSKNQNLKDTWANDVRIMLENEEKSDTAEFRVKEVQYIQAEVKIIKCLVENIVVDISFNQLGGLCTLCFLEEVDHLINQNHLFKRSIILIKAWCYYESRILGAHHGLISTYALETLVLYIFHVFNNSFAGPLEVLYRFLEFFSNFDWDNFCVSLWGPVPISALPDMTAESPRKDSGVLLLDKQFLNTCTSVYAVSQSGQENQGQPFVSKHFNVVDPLRTNNNLGRSVSKGNFFRIRSAFAFGAKKLAKLLDCPTEDLIAEVNQFFMNTWDRHGSGHRPDAPTSALLRLQPLNSDPLDGSENLKNYSKSQKMSENTSKYESEAEGTHAFHGISSQHGNHLSESMSRGSNTSALSRTQSQKHYENTISSRVSDQVARHVNCSSESVHTERVQRSRPYLVNEIQGRFQFARTRSSPELSDTSSSEVSSRGRRNKAPEMGKSQIVASRPDYNSSRRKNLGSEVSGSHSTRSSTEDPSSLRHSSSHQSLDNAADSNNASNSFHDEAGLSATGEEFASVAESMEMHQEEQDLVNMMASSGVHGFPGHIQMPVNLASPPLPLPISPSILASMGYAQRNLAGMIPTNIPLIEPHWGTNMQFPQGMVSSPLPHYFPGAGLASNPEEIIESGNETSGLTEMNHEEGDHGLWHEQDASSTRGFDPEDGIVSSSRVSSSGSSYMRDQQKFVKENRGLAREDRTDNFRYQNNIQNEVYSERIENLRFLPTSPASSSRSKVFAESAWDGSSIKVSKSTRDKRGRKTAPSLVPSTVYGKGKTGWPYEGSSVDHGSSQADDDNREWIPLSTVGTEMAERSMEPTSNKISSYESVQISGSDSMIPIAPMFLGSGSRQRTMDNSGVVPFAFYPTGPPVPFLTMLPVYNFPTETGNSEGSSSHFDREEGQDSNRVNQSDQNFDSAEILDQSDNFSSSRSIRGANYLESSEEHKPDILHSDFASHWQNLQYGRFCQNPRYPGGPLIYPSPVAVPPVYLQGHFPWDGPGRPVSGNANLITQLMGYGPRLVPVAPLQPGSSRPTGVYQRYGDEVPRYRGGTGTYLPNPKVSFRDRQSSGTKNHRGNHSYDRSDHLSDREGNWNINSKQRAAGRSHSRNQPEKPSPRSDRANKPWDSYRHESFPSYQSQTGPFGSSNSTHNGSTNVAYGMYPLPAVGSNGGAPTGPSVPSVVMLYSYGDHNVGYGSPADQLEFGSLGPVHFSGMNEVSRLGEGGSTRGVYEQQRFRGVSPARSSPDQPSSPQLQRSAGQRNYQLKDEDFPPLSFPNQGGNGGGDNYNSKPSHYQTFLFTPQS
ncbi:Nucleotidyl transferase domain [Macleaya cordata]|uniref:Nucleotidyl transferase domain n=1 Tax=Macleaya cordata TaxID=56857 RepID=A0A200PUT9_MACCD|nr:Nucleotidyl transferase domain [Macleaya cordata]